MHAEPTTLWQWFTSQDPSDVAGFAILSILAVTGIIVVVSALAYYMHKNRLQHELKRELLDRGFSAEEIALIVYGKTRVDLQSKVARSQEKVQVGQ